MIVCIGIFWKINDKIFSFSQQREVESPSEGEIISGRLDSDFAHYTEWDKNLAQLFPCADFDTYPRGRVLYDIKSNSHVIFADKCIKNKYITKIKKLFCISKCTVEHDDHYSCAKCIKYIDW